MEIRASATYNFQTVRDFSRSNLFPRGNPKIQMILSDSVASFAVLLSVYDLIKNGITTLTGIILGFCVVYLLLINYLYFLFPKTQYKSLGEYRDVKNEYVFRDKTVDVKSKKGELLGKESFSYSEITQVTETKDYFFIFPQSGKSFVVDKYSMEER